MYVAISKRDWEVVSRMTVVWMKVSFLASEVRSASHEVTGRAKRQDGAKRVLEKYASANFHMDFMVVKSTDFVACWPSSLLSWAAQVLS